MKTISLLILVAIWCISGCTIENPLEPIDIDTILTLELVATDTLQDEARMMRSVPADSTSLRIIKATIGENAAAGQTIQFNTTHGVLTKVGEAANSGSGQNLSITAEQREAVVQLNALNEFANQVLVSASIGNHTNAITLQFVPAYPDNFQVNPLAVVGDTSQPIMVEVEAFRGSGVVSEHIRFRVETTAPDSIKLNHPLYVPLSNQRGSFQIENVSKKHGPIEVTVVMPTGENDSTNKSFSYLYE
jgi:hypothetical protein